MYKSTSTHSLLLDCRAIWTEYHSLRSRGEFWEARNREILVVQVRVIVELLVGLYNDGC